MASHPDAHAAAGAHAIHHDPNIGTTGLDNRKVGMWIFLGSDCMFFGALIGTYLSYKGKSVGGPVPRDVCGMHTSKNWFGVYVVVLVGRRKRAKG